MDMCAIKVYYIIIIIIMVHLKSGCTSTNTDKAAEKRGQGFRRHLFTVHRSPSICAQNQEIQNPDNVELKTKKTSRERREQHTKENRHKTKTKQQNKTH
jgi:hypothetical protein